MKLERRVRFQPGFLYFAPAVDTVLTLLFFVLLSTAYLLQPGIAVNVPRSPFVLAPQRDPQVIGITGAPRPGIYFENREVTLEELRVRLGGAAGRPRTVIINADRSASYDVVMEVMAAALSEGLPVVLATNEAD